MKKTPKMLEVEERIGEDIEVYLKREYNIEGQSMTGISKKFGVDISTVRSWLEEYEIKRKNMSELMLPVGVKKPSKRVLDRMHNEEYFTITEMAEKIGVSSPTIKKWLRENNIKIKKGLWQTEEEWRKYGINKSYDKINPTGLIKGDDKKGRIWYNQGYIVGWTERFDFEKKHNLGRWKNEEEWVRHGIGRGYNEGNVMSLKQSENKEERVWVDKGKREGWIERFDFATKKNRWATEDKWKKYGTDNGFNEKNPQSLQKSENKEERGWVNKGYREGWTERFKFNRLRNHYIRNSKQLISFLQQDTTARNLAVAATMLNGEAYDIEQMMIDMYDSKFDNQGNLHKLLEANAREIYDLIEEGITNLGEYIGEYALGDRSIVPVLLGEAVMSLPENKVNASLEERLVRILRNQYSPRFNSNPYETLSEIEKRVSESEGKMKEIYGGLERYYGEVLELEGELE